MICIFLSGYKKPRTILKNEKQNYEKEDFKMGFKTFNSWDSNY